jgi:superoxide dismutase, Cu-Zn family
MNVTRDKLNGEDTKMRRLVGVTVLMAVLGGCAGLEDDRSPAARAVLRDKSGAQVAQATFSEGPNGVQIRVTGSGLPPGAKGIHIHAVGKCDPPEFTSAGPHFNPTGRKHGLQNPEGAHAGDLPNLTVDPSGNGWLDTTTRAVTLRPGAANSLLREGGTSLVIHAQQDDERTDPTGNSGARIACGVITQG